MRRSLSTVAILTLIFLISTGFTAGPAAARSVSKGDAIETLSTMGPEATGDAKLISNAGLSPVTGDTLRFTGKVVALNDPQQVLVLEEAKGGNSWLGWKVLPWTFEHLPVGTTVVVWGKTTGPDYFRVTGFWACDGPAPGAAGIEGQVAIWNNNSYTLVRNAQAFSLVPSTGGNIGVQQVGATVQAWGIGPEPQDAPPETTINPLAETAPNFRGDHLKVAGMAPVPGTYSGLVRLIGRLAGYNAQTGACRIFVQGTYIPVVLLSGASTAGVPLDQASDDKGPWVNVAAKGGADGVLRAAFMSMTTDPWYLP